MARAIILSVLLVSCLVVCNAGAPGIAMVSPSVGEQGEGTLISVHLTPDSRPLTKLTSGMLRRSRFEEETLVVDPTELPAKCKFDAEVVAGEYVPATPAGPARILCRAPALDVGVTGVSISLDGQLFSTDTVTFTTLYAGKPLKAASRRLLGFEERLAGLDVDFLGLPESGSGRELLEPEELMSTQTSVDQSFYGGSFYGAHGRQAMEDDELLFTEERSLLREGLGSRPTRDFDVCAFAISPEYGPSSGHTQVTIGLAGSIPEDHTSFFCKFGDLVFKASSVTPPESGEGPTMITCTVPPQVGSERVVIRISPDGSKFSAAGPTFTYTANSELYGATTDIKFTYLPFSVDNCVFFDSNAGTAYTADDQDEIAAEAASIGEGVSGSASAGFSVLQLSPAQQQQHRRRRALVQNQASEAVSEAEEIAREEAEIGEGISGALEGLIADEIASEEAFIGEGLSGAGEKVAAVDEIRAEELAVGEGLSGAVEGDERREILAEEQSFRELSGAVLSEEDEIAAEERAVGEGVSGDAQSLEGALESVSRSEQEEIEEEMRLILEGVSGDAAAIKAADDMAAAPGETFQGLFSALRSADVGKALRYARGLGLRKAEGICNVDDSVEAMRAALSQKVVELGAVEAATSSQLESVVCSLASLTGVPAATWTSSQQIVAFLEAAFAASLKADSLAVTGLSTAECAVSIMNDVLVAEEARAQCLHVERDQATMAQMLRLPALVGRALLRSQRAGMPGLAAQRSVLTLVAAKVGGNPSEVEPSFSARTGAHSCSVVVQDGPLPAGAEFDAIMYTFTAVTPLFAAARPGQGSLSALAVEYQGAPLLASVEITSANGAAPAELESQDGLRLWADAALSTPRTWISSALASTGLSLASVGMLAKYALLPVCVAWLIISVRQMTRTRPANGLNSPLIKSEV